MNDRDLQAPWVGLCREDYEDRESAIIGFCADCERPLYDGEDVYDVCDGCVCEDCYSIRQKDEED